MSDGPISGTEDLKDGKLVTVSGDVDYSVAADLRVGLMEPLKDEPQRLVVDLSAVDYMDSSGVATLVEALQQQRKNGGKMVLFGLQPKVKSIFEIARLDLVFTIVETRDAAEAA